MTLAIENVAVLDPATGGVTPRQTVVVDDERITSVQPADSVRPAATQRIDGTDRFVMPGLWDMHLHVFPRPERAFFPLFVALGITGVRDMSRPMALIDTWRAQIRLGEVIGPRLVGCGGIVDGPNSRRPFRDMIVADAAGARRMVGELKATGADFVKIYPALARPVFEELIAEARRNGLTVCGHVPVAIPVDEASDAGQRSMEHLDGFLISASTEEAELRPRLIEATATPIQSMPDSFYAEDTAEAHLARLAEALAGFERAGYSQATREIAVRSASTRGAARTQQIVDRFVHNETWQCPTLYVQHLPGQTTVFASDADDVRFLIRSLRRPARPSTTAGLTSAAAREVVGELTRGGVPLLAGTDVGPYPNMIPAVALHDELRLLVQSGLTPVQALAAATSEPARFLGRSADLGSVAAGKLADLVVLDANPFEDITRTRGLHAVVANGRPFVASELTAILDQVAEHADQM